MVICAFGVLGGAGCACSLSGWFVICGCWLVVLLVLIGLVYVNSVVLVLRFYSFVG